jgi:hypothetical protein
MISWNNPEEKLPEMDSLKTHANEYYLVLLENGCTQKAMYTDLGWCPDYNTSLITKVIGWSEINNDFKYLYYAGMFGVGVNRRRIIREDENNYYIQVPNDTNGDFDAERVVSKKTMHQVPAPEMLDIQYLEETEELLKQFKDEWKNAVREM